MEIQVEKVLMDLGLEIYIRKRMEEENTILKNELNKVNKEKQEIQKTLKSRVEDV